MGRSAGPGSPVFFKCRARRRELPLFDECTLDERHVVTLTGRTKPFRSSRGSALGQRSTDTSYEYECTCGHVGWSAHQDLARRALSAEAGDTPDCECRWIDADVGDQIDGNPPRGTWAVAGCPIHDSTRLSAEAGDTDG